MDRHIIYHCLKWPKFQNGTPGAVYLPGCWGHMYFSAGCTGFRQERARTFASQARKSAEEAGDDTEASWAKELEENYLFAHQAWIAASAKIQNHHA